MPMLDCTPMPHAGCFLSHHTSKELHTEALLIASVAAGSFKARPRGELAGWKKRWRIHASIVRASAAEVLRLQTINTEPDQTDCHFCIKAHKDALALMLSRDQSV
jgi:hypothetical protein